MAYHLCGEEQKAVETLYSVAYKKWDGRFEEVQQTALNDMNAIIAECGRRKISLDLSGIDKKLTENFDVDVRIILTWNTDDCDVDLWVTDGDGEKCFYGNRITRSGARMSRDFTQGYGPEEFCIRTAPGGKLKTVFYIISGFFFLTLESYTRFAFPFIPAAVDTIIKAALRYSTLALFVVCVLLSWGSFIDYMKSFYSIIKKND